MTISEYITEEKITQVQFAAMIGTTGTTVYRWVSGRSVPCDKKKALIAKITGNKVSTISDFTVSSDE